MTESGLEAVFMANRPRLLRFVRARGGDGDAEDIVQELWLKLSAGSAGPVAEPLSYLFRMADNLMLDRRRSRQRRVRRDEAYTDMESGPVPDVSPTPSAERMIVAREELRRVEATLAELGVRTATIFRRFRIDGASQRDIAAECGLSLSAVEKHLQKAYRALIAMRSIDDAGSVALRRPDAGKGNDGQA